MTKSSITLPKGEFTVQANEENNLPTLTNNSDKTITLKIQAEGTWTYGGKDGFGKMVDANGNPEDMGRNPYVRYPNLTPAALVAVKNGNAVASGKEQTIELQPGETVSFINNDQPGVYNDNSGSLTINWSIASIKSNGTGSNNKESSSGDKDTSIELPSGELTVQANEEQDLPSLTNESDKTIALKIQAEGTWTYGENWVFGKQVDANGNEEDTGRQSYMRFPNITPAALVAVKNDQAVGNGKEQTIELLPGETVLFINNDQKDVYFDNSGSQTVKWSIASAN